MNCPVVGSKTAPRGSVLLERATVSWSLSEVLMTSDAWLPVLTPRDDRTCRVGGVLVDGIRSCTGIVSVAVAVCCGFPLSLVVSVTV